MIEPESQDQSPELLDWCMTRRRFLFMGAAALGTLTLASVVPGQLFTAQTAAYEGKLIGSIRDLSVGVPREFKYPWDHPNATNYLIKLGVPAGGGIGPDQDIVAFNTLCPHMGFPLIGKYQPEHQVLGACPWHLSTYDLTRHGMLIAGHATASLPQILLEARGDDIYATGVMELIFGFADNQALPA